MGPPWAKRIRLWTVSPPVLAVLAVALTVGGLLAGRVPIGADPDLLYRPIKHELGRTLRSGTLPFWSDHFGIGIPLVAESHAAAFYPPNWALYGLLDVPTAYRVAMWLNYVAIAGATFAYARAVGITAWGAAISSVSFSLCGFQAAHAIHEPFYSALPYLPLSLLLAHRYVDTGRLAILALLAMSWGAAVTIGHFQIPIWIGALAFFTGAWRLIAAGRPRGRLFGLAIGLGWGLAIASVQVELTRELTQLSGFNRSFRQLASLGFPPGHLMQPVFPAIFAGLYEVVEKGYWGHRQATATESSFYVGTIPMILAGVGWVASGRGKDGVRALAPWRLIVLGSLFLACLPGSWADLYRLVTEIPVLGWFRAPGRYTLLSSFGLALLAGRGLDASISRREFGRGIALAIVVGIVSAAWVGIWMRQDEVYTMVSRTSMAIRLVVALGSWAIALTTIAAWRLGRVGGWAPFVVSAVEMAILYHMAPVVYGWNPPSPAQSPTLARLAREPNVGLVGGKLGDVVVRAGVTVAFPYLGIIAPPPNHLLNAAKDPMRISVPADRMWARRLGATHGIFAEDDSTFGLDLVFSGPDPVLDALVQDGPGTLKHRIWKLVALADPFPPAWTSTHERVTRSTGQRGWAQLYSELSMFPSIEEVWYEFGEIDAPMAGPPAAVASVRSWDGRVASVEHDGACVLVIRRTYFRGWSARVDGGPWRPVLKVDGGLQGVRLDRRGPSRVEFRYEPTGLRRFGAISIVSTAAALVVILAASIRRRSRRVGPAPPAVS